MSLESSVTTFTKSVSYSTTGTEIFDLSLQYVPQIHVILKQN